MQQQHERTHTAHAQHHTSYSLLDAILDAPQSEGHARVPFRFDPPTARDEMIAANRRRTRVLRGEYEGMTMTIDERVRKAERRADEAYWATLDLRSHELFGLQEDILYVHEGWLLCGKCGRRDCLWSHPVQLKG